MAHYAEDEDPCDECADAHQQYRSGGKPRKATRRKVQTTSLNERRWFFQYGWLWCQYHDQYESSERFGKARSGFLGHQSRCRIAQYWAKIKYKYDLTEDAWRAMLVQQSGRCALCDEPMADPVVDHSHISGEVRHLLHADCNWWAGFYEQGPDRFWRVAKKLRRLKKYNIPVEDDTTVPFAALDSAA